MLHVVGILGLYSTWAAGTVPLQGCGWHWWLTSHRNHSAPEIPLETKESLWFCWETLMTIGLGDIVPQTEAGRLLATYGIPDHSQ